MMCDFEDWPIISKYPLSQAIDDGVLVRVMRFNNKLVVATSRMVEDFGTEELISIFHEFRVWDEKVRPGLPEEEQLFKTQANEKAVWVIEDGAAYTIMYPEDY